MPKDMFKPKSETTTTNPMASAQPAIDGIIGAAGDWYNSKQGQQAPMNAYTKSALNQTRALSSQPVTGFQTAIDVNGAMINNGGYTPDLRVAQNFLNPFAAGQYNEDPRLAASIAERENRAKNAAATQFGGGRYGSNAIGQGMGSAMATAGNDLMLQSNENARTRQLQASGLLGNMAEGARSAVMQGTSMLPMLDNLRYSGAERMAGVGDYYQNRAQERQDMPFNRLSQYGGLISQMSGGYGSTTKPKAGNAAMSAVGGALSGAKLGSALGPWGTAIGGIGGGLLGAGSF